MTLSDAFERYRLDRIVFANQSRKTEENHYVCLRALKNYFGDIEIESLDMVAIRNWKMSLDKNRSPNTVRNYILKLRVVLRHIRECGVPVINPETIPVPRRSVSLPQFLSAEEVVKLIDSTYRIKNKAIIALLYASGIRVSELCSLNIADLRNGSFTVIGKGDQPRLCFYDHRAAEYIRIYLDSREDHNPALFLTDGGTRIIPGAIQETFKSVRKISGLSVHPHTLRHSYATNLMQNGMHLYPLSRLLGHRSIQTTATYLHVTDLKLQEEYERYHTI